VVRFAVSFLLLFLPVWGVAQRLNAASEQGAWPDAPSESLGASSEPAGASSELRDAPGEVLDAPVVAQIKPIVWEEFAGAKKRDQSRASAPRSRAEEPYHWKGLLLQSFAIQMF
jgi:hypothetical protein